MLSGREVERGEKASAEVLEQKPTEAEGIGVPGRPGGAGPVA